MRQCPELPPPILLQCIQQFAKMHSRFEEAYYAKHECWNASLEFVDYAKKKLQKAMYLADAAELKVVCAGNHPCYKRYCEDEASHWVVAAGEWRIDFTARQFHRWFAFPRVWKETKKQGKHGKMDQSNRSLTRSKKPREPKTSSSVLATPNNVLGRLWHLAHGPGVWIKSFGPTARDKEVTDLLPLPPT